MSTQKKHTQRNYIPSARGNARKAVDETRLCAYNCRIEGIVGASRPNPVLRRAYRVFAGTKQKKELYPYESCKYESAPLPSVRKRG